MTKIFKILALIALVSLSAFAQSPISSTTLSGSLVTSNTQACVASATNIVTPSLGAAAPSGSILMVDNEAMTVVGSGISSTCFKVKRGTLGTQAQNHATSAKVWVMGVTTSTGDPSRPLNTSVFIARPAYDPLQVVATPALAAVTPGSITDVNGKVWFDAVLPSHNSIATGACILNGATVGTDKWIVALYDNAGNLLANSATAGTTTAGASQYQCLAFGSPVALLGQQQYFLALQGNGTTDNFKAYAAGGAPSSYPTGSVTGGTFGTLPNPLAITTTFTASVGPLFALY